MNRKRYISLLSVGVLTVVVGSWIWSEVIPTSSAPGNFNLSSGSAEKVAAKKTTLPLYVYGDPSGRLSKFVPSGYMGDMEALSALTSTYDATAPVSTGRLGRTSLIINYAPKGKQGWSGIYWLTPANNWGTLKGAGFDLRKGKKLTFWARGEKGGEVISQIKVGGVNGPYPDSDSATMGPLKLTPDWTQYTLDLAGKDLRHIVGGFMFLLRRADNPKGAKIYFDEIVFRGDPRDEVEPAVVKRYEEDEPPINSSFAGPGDASLSTGTRKGSGFSTVSQGPSGSGLGQAVMNQDGYGGFGSLDGNAAGRGSRGNTDATLTAGQGPLSLPRQILPVPTPARYLKYKKVRDQ